MEKKRLFPHLVIAEERQDIITVEYTQQIEELRIKELLTESEKNMLMKVKAVFDDVKKKQDSIKQDKLSMIEPPLMKRINTRAI